MLDIFKENKSNIKIIFMLAIPVIIENILQTFLGTVDTYFAGTINDNAIAAISVTNLIINIFISFYTAISIGSSSIISRNFGKKDFYRVNLIINQSIIVGLIIGLIIGLINIILYKPILSISGVTKEVLHYAIPYYIAVVVPSVFLCLSLILSSCLRSIKDTKTPMVATAIANIVNIFLNLIFIKAGLGIIGLGLATTISRLVNVVILFIKLKRGTNGVKLNVSSFKIDKTIINSILKIGGPAGLEKLIMRIGQLVYNGMIISIGVSTYVAHNIAGNIESYSYVPAMGFGVATATLVGIYLGENDIKKSKELVFLSDIITTIFMVFIGLIFFIFAPQLASIFTETKEIQQMVIMVLRLIALFQPFGAITQIMTSALQGAGDTKFPMYATIIGTWFCRVGLGYVIGVKLGFGLLGVWIGYGLDLTIRSIILIKRFLSGNWQIVKV